MRTIPTRSFSAGGIEEGGANAMMLTKRSWYATQPAMGFAEIREQGTDRLIFAVANPSPAHGDVETSDEEKHANLALAAASPGLLEALRIAHTAIGVAIDDTCGGPIQEMLHIAEPIVKAAIAKAEVGMPDNPARSKSICRCITCLDCAGRGKVQVDVGTYDYPELEIETCTMCRGTGVTEQCSHCDEIESSRRA